MLSAYDLPEPLIEHDLTDVGRGTPMGELLRRYWHPIGLLRDAGATPRQIRVLGEDLILFRDGQGRPGLLHPRCAHRGTSLIYGRTEANGIRCCYHGWLFDVEGNCLEQPCEPLTGAGTVSRVKQPGYPVVERYGLIFAYMGPPDQQPVLPRYDILEEQAEGEFVEADDNSIGGGGAVIIPCNWLQHFENVMDPFHVPILHGSFSGTQFIEKMNLMPHVKFEQTDRGIRSTQIRDLGDDMVHCRITETVLPNIRAVANPRTEVVGKCSILGWVLPIDDTSFRIYSAARVDRPGTLGEIRARINGKFWSELTAEEHRDYPGDFEAQVGQGEITLHSEENLVTSDRGVGMLRRLYRRQLAELSAGGTPMGVHFNPDEEMVRLDAGTAILNVSDA